LNQERAVIPSHPCDGFARARAPWRRNKRSASSNQSYVKVGQLLREQGFSLQSNRKVEEGGDHPDRDAQFRHINAEVKRALASGMPIISVDTKKKELIGNYVNKGQQWRPKKTPRKVNGHDFPHPSVPRAHPYDL
jgi:hypothetical protein